MRPASWKQAGAITGWVRKGLRVRLSKWPTEAAIAFAKRTAASMPPIRLMDLAADIDRMTGFSFLFEHQTGRTLADTRVFYAANDQAQKLPRFSEAGRTVQAPPPQRSAATTNAVAACRAGTRHGSWRTSLFPEPNLWNSERSTAIHHRTKIIPRCGCFRRNASARSPC